MATHLTILCVVVEPYVACLLLVLFMNSHCTGILLCVLRVWCFTSFFLIFDKNTGYLVEFFFIHKFHS